MARRMPGILPPAVYARKARARVLPVARRLSPVALLPRRERVRHPARLDPPALRRFDVGVLVAAPVIEHRRLVLAADGHHLDVLAAGRAFGGGLDDEVLNEVLVAPQLD